MRWAPRPRYAVSASAGDLEIYPDPVLATTLLREVVSPAVRVPACPQEGEKPVPAWCRGEFRWEPAAFGPLIWASEVVPPGQANATDQLGILTVGQLSGRRRSDLSLFMEPAAAGRFSPDSCRNGSCAPMGGEQTVYHRPHSPDDVILYRSTGCSAPLGTHHREGEPPQCVLLASTRDTSRTMAESNWSAPVATNIPDINSNINAGSLSVGGVFLVSNAVPRLPWHDAPCNRTTVLREPLVLSLSRDGKSFSAAWAVFNSSTPKRYCGSAKSVGPSYPQAREVVGESPDLNGLWIAYSVNKEDVGVTYVPTRVLATAPTV